MHTPVPGSAMNSQPFSVLTGRQRVGAGTPRAPQRPGHRRRRRHARERERRHDHQQAADRSDTTAPKVHHRSSPSPPSRPRSRGPAAVIAQTWGEPYRLSSQPSFTEGVVVVQQGAHATEEEVGIVLKWGIAGWVSVLVVVAAWLPAPAAAAGEGCPKAHGGPAARGLGHERLRTARRRLLQRARELLPAGRGAVGGDGRQGRLQVRPGADGRLHAALLGHRQQGPARQRPAADRAAPRDRQRSHRSQGNRGRQRPRDGAALRRHRLDLGRLRIRRAGKQRKGL